MKDAGELNTNVMWTVYLELCAHWLKSDIFSHPKAKDAKRSTETTTSCFQGRTGVGCSSMASLMCRPCLRRFPRVGSAPRAQAALVRVDVRLCSIGDDDGGRKRSNQPYTETNGTWKQVELVKEKSVPCFYFQVPNKSSSVWIRGEFVPPPSFTSTICSRGGICSSARDGKGFPVAAGMANAKRLTWWKTCLGLSRRVRMW